MALLHPFVADDELSRVYTLCDLLLTSYLAKRILSIQRSVDFPVTQSFVNGFLIRHDFFTYQSWSQLSNAIVIVRSRRLRSKLFPSKLFLSKVCPFCAQVVK